MAESKSQFQARVSQLTADFEAELAKEDLKIERAEKSKKRAERKKRSLNADFQRRLQALSKECLGIDTEEDAALQARPGRPRMKRGRLDEGVYELAGELGGEFTVAQVYEAWTKLNPDDPVKRQTVRGVLERLVKKEKIRVVHPGSRGSGNPKRYGCLVRSEPEGANTTEESDETRNRPRLVQPG